MKNLKLNKNLIILLVIVVAVASCILQKPLNNLDEIWNYNFAKNIAEGKLPYKDFNMVQTPLLPIICGMFLKLIANELIIMRILAIIMCSTILFLIYRILEILKVNKHVINISVMSIYFLLYNHFCIDYNFATILIVLITMYVEVKELDKKQEILKTNRKQDFLLGILTGTTILFKQTTGIIITLIFIFYKLLLVSKKEEYKIAFKIIINRFLGTLIPILGLVLYLTINNIWIDFLDYCIYGVKTFSNYISYKALLLNYGLIIKILSILIPIAIIYMYIISIVKSPTKNESKNIFIIFSYSVASFVMAFPISDSIHFLIGAIPGIIGLLYILNNFFNKIKENKYIKYTKEYMKSVEKITLVLGTIALLLLIYGYIIEANKYKDLRHFKYIPSQGEGIKLIDQFIKEQEKEVYILDATSAIYMIPIDRYNKNYDMFLLGNLGEKGESGQIESLKNKKDTIVLIMNENYSRNWQNPEQVRKYIIENWKKTGEISCFDIYEN